ncbi:MAG: ADP-forming succinate--CoA ligase subunit beta [Alphaproteobacteria bacterium]|nr:ADP-forming succinate--CoA ligase subunit beta [Alphaproteobacteria bacterium]
MNIHEYQAKSLLKKYGVAVQRGRVALTPTEAVDVAKTLAAEVKTTGWVLKAQIHAGGRGKGGGIRVVKSLEAVEAEAKRMIGMTLVTPQTGLRGQKVQKIFVEEVCDIRRELYLGLSIDPAAGCVTIMGSTEGGAEIEEVATRNPEKIIKVSIDPMTGLQPRHARQIAFSLGLKNAQVGKCVSFLQALYAAFIELDCEAVEINPLAVTGADEMIALDCKMSFDDNALFRHADIAAMRDEAEEDPAESIAKKSGLDYIKLDGNIGCIVKGAGLALATMDIIKLYGGEPANFLDVGGGATRERVTAALGIILSNKNVKGVFINIFGGIMRCDIVAEGIVAAAREAKLQVPLVVRLEGANVDLGKKILTASGLPILTGDNLADGAKKIVRAVQSKAA